jgi:chromosome segregation ATPase
MAKKKKKPSEELIDSVLTDLKNDSDEPSLNESSTSTPDEHRESASHATDSSNEKTAVLGQEATKTPAHYFSSLEADSNESERTVLAGSPKKSSVPEEKISFGSQQSDFKSSAYEAQFQQAENLKIAQQRIVELEKDIERLRKENEVLISAGEIAQQKLEDLSLQFSNLERAKHDLKEQSESELRIFRDGLQVKDSEILRLRNKVDELESRLANDLKKIRVRERELENRLELAKMEKSALSRSKDETILDLKRRVDHLNSEIENYKDRVLDLNQKLEANHEQFGRTVRALRIALTNLEVNENTSSITIAPIKKAE